MDQQMDKSFPKENVSGYFKVAWISGCTSFMLISVTACLFGGHHSIIAHQLLKILDGLQETIVTIYLVAFTRVSKPRTTTTRWNFLRAGIVSYSVLSLRLEQGLAPCDGLVNALTWTLCSSLSCLCCQLAFKQPYNLIINLYYLFLSLALY